uniref:Uncharacterized protein n=1 Tax=Cacopsylla melanoneura TaxID=428564 RepID=A0A8D8QRS3_9HEMI
MKRGARTPLRRLSSISSRSVIVTEPDVLASPASFTTRISYFPVVFLVVFLMTSLVTLSLVSISSSTNSLPFLNHLISGLGTPVYSASRVTVESLGTSRACRGRTMVGASNTRGFSMVVAFLSTRLARHSARPNVLTALTE